jgi:hypothetical protein
MLEVCKSAPEAVVFSTMGPNMPNPAISIQRIAQDAVRVQFDPGGGQGTAVFMIDLAREMGGTLDEVDRRKVLLKAKSVAESFIGNVNGEVR